MTTIPIEENVFQLLTYGSGEERAAFANRLPPSPFNEEVKLLIRSENPGMVITALLGSIYHYCEGANPDWGAVLAAAAHRRAIALWQAASDHQGLRLETLSGLADSHCTALMRLGRSPELLRAADRYIAIHASLADSHNIPQMKIRRAEALLNLKRVDDAEDALTEMQRAHPEAHGEAHRLRRIIDEWKVQITKVKGGDSTITPTIAPENAPDLVDLMGQMIARFGPLGEMTDVVARQKIQQASLIFLGTPPRNKILQSLESLQSPLGWARQNGLTTLENEALWGIYLCFSRLNRYSDAADSLIQLRKNLEAIRRGIKDPQQRGGVFANHPHLFGAMCEYLYKADRPDDLLEAIEASKGRAIADRLTQQEGAAVDDAAIYHRVRSLPELARREAFHYLTFFVDDKMIYAVLVTRQGDIIMPDPIPIERRDLQHLADEVDPRRWGKPQRDNPAARIENLQVALAPVVAWLDRIVEAGALSKGDHICYSTDDALDNVPLHYLSFKKALLIDWFSLSRVHSAFHVDHLLRKPASRAPDRHLGVAVGLRDEQANAAFLDSLQAPLRWLQDHGPAGRALVGADATLARVAKERLNDRIVHFSTHGMFPNGLKSPFDDSYLLLADEEGLPVDGRGGKLSPNAIFAASLDFSGSHVSIMACISGLSRKGVAGDSLGLDWAFIQAGAISLISTHWDVNVSAAARFFIFYYENWITREHSRAEAHREAMLELLGDDRSGEALSKWSAFSLTGDFR